MEEPESPWWRRIPKVSLGQYTFVMATGIVSTALHNTGADILSMIVFVIAVGGFVLLTVLALLRFAYEPRQLGAQLRIGGFTTLAFTAACGVLGARFAELGIPWAAITLSVVGVVTWLLLGYIAVALAVVSSLATRAPRGLLKVDGTWFLWVVATQSVAVSSAAVAHTTHRYGFAIIAALCWCIGLLQLIVVAGIVGARLLVAPLRARDEIAPYWVFMGSSAISVLAGAELLAVGSEQTLLDPEIIGSACMALWSFATWLIPLLVAMMIWHARRPGTSRGFRTPLWAMVFPIGMYGESSRELGAIRGTHWLDVLGTWESWVALAVWLVVFAGMLGWWWRWWTDCRGSLDRGGDKAPITV